MTMADAPFINLPWLPGGAPPEFAVPAFDTRPVITAISPNYDRVAGGASVTITGRNFRNATVLIDGNPATNVVVVSSTEITCDTPAGTAGVVDVVVTCDTESATLPASFTYIQATLSSVEPKYGTVAGGLQVVLVGTNFDTSETYTVEFDGVAATDVTVLDESHILVVTPNHAVGFVDVVLTGSTETSTLRHGFQYTLLTRGEDIRRQPGINIRDVLNDSPNTCSFTVDGTSNVPEVGEKIEITDEQDGDRLLFAGTVVSVDQTFEEQADQLVFHVNAIDFTWLLNKYYPVGNYENMPANLIVKDLATKFAPGFDVTSFVQSNLAKVSAEFDGSRTFSECLTLLANAIGGGHWYVDYEQKIHFFHTPIEGTLVGALVTGPGTAPVITEGVAIASPYRHENVYVALCVTFVYDDSFETAPSPLSDFVSIESFKQADVSSIPIGATIGTHAVTKRRLYAALVTESGFNLALGKLEPYAEIGDNTTTDFTSDWAYINPDTTVVSAIDTTTVVPPVIPLVNAPIAPPSIPTARQRATGTVSAANNPPFTQDTEVVTYTPGPWSFKVAAVYRNGTISLATPATIPVILDGIRPVDMTNLPIALDVNEVNVIGRVIFGSVGQTVTRKIGDGEKSLSELVGELQASHDAGTLASDWGPDIGFGDAGALQALPSIPRTYDALGSIIGFADLDALLGGGEEEEQTPPDWSPEHTRMWFFLADNTTLEATIGPSVGREGALPALNPGDTDSTVPTWPYQKDGPYLEDFDLPEDIIDGSEQLLLDPPITLSSDLTQVRNRIKVRGAGSPITLGVPLNSIEIPVAELSYFAPQGGKVMINSHILEYKNLSSRSGPGAINLKTPTSQKFIEGDLVSLYFQADDLASQKLLAKAELDKDGNKTDGVHEYPIVDGELKTPFQLFMRAFAELERYAFPILTVRYATRDPNTRAGARVNIDLSDPPIQGQFLIQDVSIDQIHDESDQLMPRYTVTASSVRYNLEDLLKQILRVQATTLTTAGIVSASSPTPGSEGRFPINFSFEKAMPVSGGTGVSQYRLGYVTSSTQTGTVTGRNDTDGSWIRLTTAASIDASAAFQETPLQIKLRHNPITECILKSAESVSNMTGAVATFADRSMDSQPRAIEGGTAVGAFIGMLIQEGKVRPFIWGKNVGGFTGANSVEYLGDQFASIAPTTIIHCATRIDWATKVVTFEFNGQSFSKEMPSPQLWDSYDNLLAVTYSVNPFAVQTKVAVAKAFEFSRAYGEANGLL